MTTLHILFTKSTQRNVAPAKTESQISMMQARVSGAMHSAGLSFVKADHAVTGSIGSYQFTASFVVRHTGVGDPLRDVESIARDMATVGGVYGWTLDKVFKAEGSDAEGQQELFSEFTVQPPDDDVEDAAINLGEAAPYFSHLFERNAQISVVLSAVEAARSTRFEHRFHTVLEGPPGCGKTAIALALAEMVGESHVIKFDGPSCTKAGLENFFLNADNDISGPKVMLFEEIEKAEPDALKILLGILDSRGEVRKTTGNDGQLSRDVKVLCIATVNNVALFEKLHAGALASRFTHKVFCPRPSRKCLESILAREVQSVNGNPAWIGPALDYTLEVEGTTDPRRVIAVCLSGRDGLLTGTYQRALKSIHKKRR